MMKTLIKNLLRPIYRIYLSRKKKREFAQNLERITQELKAPGKKIIYAITPPSRLKNIGDQAQFVAIEAWLKRHFPEHAIVEVDKDEATWLTDSYKSLVDSSTPIVLHSGGNMGDRAMWSETSRRIMIESFPDNTVLSLPQTIYFHDTDFGQLQKSKTEAIYNNHKNLTVVARDNKSSDIANEMFPKCKLDKAPDFVLSYNEQKEPEQTNGKILYCMRKDSESAYTQTDLEQLFASADRPYDVFDTTIPEAITKELRKAVLDDTLTMFSQYDYIVTDRFHGLIFSVLCKKPTVVLPTVDHKLTSAFDWFDEVKFVKFAHKIQDVPAVTQDVLAVQERTTPNWNELHFDKLVKYIK